MEVISTIFAFLCGVCFISTPVLLVIFIIMLCLKSKKKKTIGFITLGVAISIVPLSIIGVLTDPATWCEHQWTVTEVKEPTCTDKGYISKHCPLCDKTDTDYEKALGHTMTVIENEGEIVSRCSVCGYETVKKLNTSESSQSETATWCEHQWEVVEEVSAICMEKGHITKRCSLCEDEKTEYIDALGHDMKEVSRVEPTQDSDGEIVSRCDRCSYEIATKIEKLPYDLDANEWYSRHCSETSDTKYLDQKVKVSGIVLYISDYSDLKGYYLAGGFGQGLVCWVDSDKLDAQLGQYIQYVGTVVAENSKHIEISDGEILSAEYPSEKLTSPVTISEWSWSRDSVGGVEWNFKFTNNTDKAIKYIWLEWNCYNAVGDLVFDEITGKSSHGVKYTGPLESGKTTDLLCNTTLFYSYSFKTARLKRFEVEFMDGTRIYITDAVYTDIIVE